MSVLPVVTRVTTMLTVPILLVASPAGAGEGTKVMEPLAQVLLKQGWTL